METVMAVVALDRVAAVDLDLLPTGNDSSIVSIHRHQSSPPQVPCGSLTRVCVPLMKETATEAMAVVAPGPAAELARDLLLPTENDSSIA